MRTPGIGVPSTVAANVREHRGKSLAALTLFILGPLTASTGQATSLTGSEWTQSTLSGARAALGPLALRRPDQELADIKRLSGLTWDQIAECLGVDRRSLHHWMKGQPVATENEKRLRGMATLVRRMPASAPADARALMMDTSSGSSMIEDLAAGADPAFMDPRAPAHDRRPAYVEAVRLLRAGELQPIPRSRGAGDVREDAVGEITLERALKAVGSSTPPRARTKRPPQIGD